MKCFYFQEKFSNGSENNAASKGIYDVDLILEDILGNQIINQSNVSSIEVEGQGKLRKAIYYFKPQNFKLMWNLLKLHGQNIIIQYPFYKGKMFDSFDSILRKLMLRNRVFLIVHDIDSLRSEEQSLIAQNNAVKSEVELLNKADSIILHNQSMYDVLSKNGLNVPHIIKIEVFDYLIGPDKISLDIKRELSKNIVFAGNLSKSQFISKLPELNRHNITIQMYGPFFPESLNSCPFIHYNGNLDAEEIVFKLKGSFGLVWDGPSLDTCEGQYGNYMKYNNPFKVSMYIAAQLPIIIWKGAAIADFIQKNNIGITVDSLEDIEPKINALTEESYEIMLKNIRELSYKVRQGEFMETAMKNLIRIYE